ncbi:Neuronal acetylcholine receptor subunit alpha-6, partial [Pseudolycoriella hygida]
RWIRRHIKQYLTEFNSQYSSSTTSKTDNMHTLRRLLLPPPFSSYIAFGLGILISLPSACLAGSHEKRLLHHLLDAYNVLERPVVNESDPLQLSFGLTLMQIIDVFSLLVINNTINQSLVTEININVDKINKDKKIN